MYAHQVIDHLNSSKYKGAWLFDQSLVENDIKNAVQFYIDSPGQLMGSAGLSGEFQDFGEETFCPPYQKTWIDTAGVTVDDRIPGEDKCRHASKIGALVVDDKKNDYLVFSFLWFQSEKTWAINPIGHTVKHLSKGTFFRQVWFYDRGKDDRDDPDESYTYLASMAHASLLLSRILFLFLSAKNITTIDNPPPKKLNKKRAKSGKCPLFTYKTLGIKPTGKKQASQEAQGLWENRVHLCRGHFKTYTDDNPLFGKFTGRYWWQPSVRGNKKKGVVMKDYRVEAA